MMSSHHHRILFPILIGALLSLSGCKQKARLDTVDAPLHPTPYKVYQGVGDLGEEKGGRVCLLYGKEEHCWNAGDGFSEMTDKSINLRSGRRLILVSAQSKGGSDGVIDLALLDEQNEQPVNLLPSAEISSANSGQWDYWQIENISPMPIILIANTVWSDDTNVSNAEDRKAAHQFKITAYAYDAAASRYIQRFEYESSKKYLGEDVIALEKQTILKRLNGAETQ
jgi:hypothetical protein